MAANSTQLVSLSTRVRHIGWAGCAAVLLAMLTTPAIGQTPGVSPYPAASSSYGSGVLRLSDRRPAIRAFEGPSPFDSPASSAPAETYVSLGTAAAQSPSARFAARPGDAILPHPSTVSRQPQATPTVGGELGNYSLEEALAVMQGKSVQPVNAQQPVAAPAYSPQGGCVAPCDCDTWQLLPTGLIYRSYLAGARESRFHSGWMNDSKGGNIWDISLGGRVGLLRYGSSGERRPTGFQLDIEGAGLVRLDRDENGDVDAADFRFGIPLTWGTEWHQVKLGYYHLSSHLGDEFLLKHPNYNRLNYSRDAIVLGYSYYHTPRLRLYAEVDYAPVIDVTEPWAFQFGVDYAPADRTGPWGEPFAAVNVHLREEFEFSGNFVAQAGWAWRRNPASGLFRIGLEYFNGHSEQYSFFGLVENKIGASIWYDY